MRNWQVLFLLAAALVALSIYVLEGDSESISLSPSLVEQTTTAPDTELARPSEPVERALASTDREVPIGASRPQVTEPASSLIAELADLLDVAVLDRPNWTRAARALAGSLGEAGTRETRAILSSAGLSQAECIAAAELLRIVTSADVYDFNSSLDYETLRRLREAQADVLHPAEAIAATRVLAGAGEWADALHFVDEFLWTNELQRRVDVGWCLAVNRRPAVAQYFASNLSRVEDAQKLERGLATLVAMGPEQLDDLARMQLVQATTLALDGAEPERVRALTHYLSKLDPDGASSVLLAELDTVEDLQEARDLSRLLIASASESVARELAERFQSESDPVRRLALAEGLLPSLASEGFDDVVREEAFHMVAASALNSSVSVARRRGVLVLGAVHEARAAEVLLQVLIRDSDARVRGAAAHALANVPVELLSPLRAEIDELQDSSLSVQKALGQLRRSARDQG